MSDFLWSLGELQAVTEAVCDESLVGSTTGFSIDTRTLKPGEVFIALKDQRDGHDFVPAAFKAEAAAAIVDLGYRRQPGDGILLRVSEPLAALQRIAAAARRRLKADCHIIAVTGSAGKTTTKDMLRIACSAVGATHASGKSFNNHLGVPLTLATTPPDTEFAIFEIGMNHAGEITPLSQLVRPHVAIVTTVAPAHLAHFTSEEEIADAKAEIFLGLESGGTAVINLDNRHAAHLARAARGCGARIVGVTLDPTPAAPLAADLVDGILRGQVRTRHDDGVRVMATLAQDGRQVEFDLGAPGDHMVRNALCAAAALEAIGADVARALAALAEFHPTAGRGARYTLPCKDGEILLIDESYNANPASVRAALAVLGKLDRQRHPRRIAVLGDMLELGAKADDLHRDLHQAIDAAGVDLVFAAGAHMAHLFARLPARCQGAWGAASQDITDALLATLQPGDAVMVKGSNSSRMGLLVEAIKAKFV
jgi:UDP-N-acetylmuramoyl-tripeptide--D-alanyl-D-alanine ligase